MKLRRVLIQNVRSFLDAQELHLDGDISIVIGPNGGGKTNLLDTVVMTLRRHLLRSWVRRQIGNPENPRLEMFEPNDAINNARLERNVQAKSGLDQVVELELEITKRDVENIAMMRESVSRMLEFSKDKYANHQVESINNWPRVEILPGDRFTFRVVNDQLQNPSSAAWQLVLNYLIQYEIDARLRDEMGEDPLSTPILSLPTSRAGGGFASSVSLSSFNEYDHKKSVDIATSRSGTSLAVLAVGRFATKYRLLLEKDTGGAMTEFLKDPQVEQLTAALRRLGYEWALESANPMQNSYDIRLKKQGSSFLVGDASSGEKELLTYIFAVFGLNVRDALIIVDEPELHLHPRWQSALLALFEQLARDTGNQFLLATHSPVFISPASIRYVSRVFSDQQRSRIRRLDDASLPDRKHLFSIVNSQNNERIFFTDRVVLVEGISDRMFFERVLAKFTSANKVPGDFEIVAVGGKGFFAAYTRLLRACGVQHVIVADLDYATDVGTDEVKKLFSVNPQKIKSNVIDVPTSTDAIALVNRLDDAIANGNIDDLKDLWAYIKSRQCGSILGFATTSGQSC